MNIYITENIDKAIDNFTIIPIVYGEIDFKQIPDNAATNIVAIDATDSIKPHNIQDFIQNIVKKMRLNSTLHIGGTDLYAISRLLLSGSMTIIEYNSILDKKNGIYSSKLIIDLLKNQGLQIKSAIFKSYNYEIIATRTYNK